MDDKRPLHIIIRNRMNRRFDTQRLHLHGDTHNLPRQMQTDIIVSGTI